MIPIFNLSRQYKTIKKELNNTFTQTAAHGQFILGQNVLLLSRNLLNLPARNMPSVLQAALMP